MSCRTCDLIRGLLMSQGVPQPVVEAAVIAAAQAEPVLVKTAKRKVSKYQRAFGKNMKALVAKHPRTKPKDLLAKAHAMTRKEMKK